MNPNISLPQLPDNLDPALRDYLFAWQKLITSKQLDDYAQAQKEKTDLLNNGSGIIEIGSNTNGQYYRFANGVMLCWKNDAIFFPYGQSTTQYADWQFPRAFRANTEIGVFYTIARTDEGGWIGMGQISQNGLKIYALDRYTAQAAYYPYYHILDTNVYLHCFAIGLW